MSLVALSEDTKLLAALEMKKLMTLNKDVWNIMTLQRTMV
jgi:hypothetical protein